MSSTKLEVEYVAELARIQLTPEEVNTFRSQLEIVLQHVERLNQVDVSNVEPMAHSFPIYNVFRNDEPRNGLDNESALANAPRRAQGLFMVTKVVE
ncbi:MAG TPA: Asp-tRNA(Asn)/Glu-tRNA(Gln) amidotransferase subunit GatC [Chthoniobacterales bacterium]|jgi:aspartyl-tRNA(Asn)/glutamyl-tRNA(Gln) amidotransferase subunit C|nr:Asp-tRNA(Asn)/Glu-tRNA(Gln) amidotransferase subunit GatC [Chthoniobacterales bacterium]